jgi:hypothetical protein
MAQAPLTDAQLRAALDAVAKHGNVTAAAAALNMPRPTLAVRYKRGVRKFGDPQPPSPTAPTEGFVAHGDTAEASRITDQRVRTLADLIRVCDIDTTEWEIERWVANKWEVGAKDKAGELTTKPLFQVKAWLKRKVEVVAARQEISTMIAEAKRHLPPRMPIARTATGDHMLEIAIPDLHVGKLAWAPETGGGHYDIKIAVQRFNAALEALVQRTASVTYGKVLLVVGNDLLNADNLANTTTRGTPQDTDGRFQKAFSTTRKMLCDAVDRLRRVAPVHVLVVPGNHDFVSSFCLGDALECYFHQTPDVFVDNTPTSRKYVRFGTVLLGFTHGDKGKRGDFGLLMATERPEDFGATRHREWHTGHLHQTRVEEKHGVRVRISPSLVEADAWHSANHYVGNQMAAEAYVWSADEGLVLQATYTVPRS